MEEVRICTTGCGSTAQGADEISVELMKARWDTIRPFVTQLFRACVVHGFHSSRFKMAELILLQEPGRGPSTFKSWRPIAFLSYFGKDLKRIIANQMARLAIVNEVVGR